MHEWTGCGGGWMSAERERRSMASLPFWCLDPRPLGAFAACQRQHLCRIRARFAPNIPPAGPTLYSLERSPVAATGELGDR